MRGTNRFLTKNTDLKFEESFRVRKSEYLRYKIQNSERKFYNEELHNLYSLPILSA